MNNKPKETNKVAEIEKSCKTCRNSGSVGVCGHILYNECGNSYSEWELDPAIEIAALKKENEHLKELLKKVNNDFFNTCEKLGKRIEEADGIIENLNPVFDFCESFEGESNLEVINFHLNGDTEPLQSFMDNNGYSYDQVVNARAYLDKYKKKGG